MPITVQRIEPHIYLSTYSGSTSINEMFEAIQQRKMIADRHQETYYVSIADLSAFNSIPFEVVNIRRAVASDSRNIMSLAVGASLQVRALAEGFKALLRINLEFYDTLEEALGRARHLLAEGEREPN